jgi:replication factor C subunit 1
MSSGNKKKRLMYDIERCMKNVISANKSEVATDYMSLLRNRLVVPLIEEGLEGIEEVVELMKDYGRYRV